MSVQFYRGSPGKFDSRTLSRETLSRWTGRIIITTTTTITITITTTITITITIITTITACLKCRYPWQDGPIGHLILLPYIICIIMCYYLISWCIQLYIYIYIYICGLGFRVYMFAWLALVDATGLMAAGIGSAGPAPSLRYKIPVFSDPAPGTS